MEVLRVVDGGIHLPSCNNIVWLWHRQKWILK